MVSIPNKPTVFDPKNWGDPLTPKQVGNIRVPVQVPDSYRAFPHEQYISLIERELDKQGFVASEGVHYACKSRVPKDSNGNPKINDLPERGRFLSLWGVKHPLLPDIPGLSWEVGGNNSYDMSCSNEILLARRVLICSNGMVLSKIDSRMRKKHTKGIDRDYDGQFERLQIMVQKAIGNLHTMATEEAGRIENRKQVEVTDDDMRYLCVEAAKDKVIGWAAIERVMEHWHNPEHVEFKDRNLWSAENAFTSNDRGANVMTQGTRFSRLDSIIAKRYGEESCSNLLQSANSPADW